MGRPINTHNTIAKMPDIARIQNAQQQRDETQRRQFALALQEEAARKESQVQTSHKPESAEIHEKSKDKSKRRKRRKRQRRGSPPSSSQRGRTPPSSPFALIPAYAGISKLDSATREKRASEQRKVTEELDPSLTEEHHVDLKID